MKKIVFMRLAALVGVAVVGVLLTCGSQLAGAQERSRTYKVDQKNTAFVPQHLVVRRGATVTFENHDSTEHNVTLAMPEAGKTVNRDLGTFPPGQKVSYTLEQPGIVRVHCNIHPEMTATIVVR